MANHTLKTLQTQQDIYIRLGHFSAVLMKGLIWLFGKLIVNFLLKKIFGGNLNKGTLLAEIDFTLKVTYILTNEIASVRFPRKILF